MVSNLLCVFSLQTPLAGCGGTTGSAGFSAPPASSASWWLTSTTASTCWWATSPPPGSSGGTTPWSPCRSVRTHATRLPLFSSPPLTPVSLFRLLVRLLVITCPEFGGTPSSTSWSETFRPRFPLPFRGPSLRRPPAGRGTGLWREEEMSEPEDEKLPLPVCLHSKDVAAAASRPHGI